MAGKFHVSAAAYAVGGGLLPTWREVRAYDEGYHDGISGAPAPDFGGDERREYVYNTAKMEAVQGLDPGFCDVVAPEPPPPPPPPEPEGES